MKKSGVYVAYRLMVIAQLMQQGARFSHQGKIEQNGVKVSNFTREFQPAGYWRQ